MATIFTRSCGTWGFVIGTSEDGRVVANSFHDDVYIDGRRVRRRRWCDPKTGYETDDEVPADLWKLAVQTMYDIAAEQERLDEAQREREYAILDRAEDALRGIERVRGGACDPNTY